MPNRVAAIALASALAVVAVGLALLYPMAESRWSGQTGLPLDDSWIHLQFARNLALGEGLSYQDGELVAGSTGPLWTALLSLFFLLGLPPIVSAKVLGFTLHLAGGWAVWRLARSAGLSGGLSVLAPLLLFATDALIWGAFSAMEIPLFVLLSTLGLAEHLRELREGGAPRSLALLGAACLARPEGLLLLALVGFDRLAGVHAATGEDRRRRWREGLTGVALVVLVLTPALLVSLRSQAALAPTTLEVKTDGVQRLIPRLQHLWLMAEVLFRSQPWMVAFAAGGAARWIGGWGGERSRGVAVALWPGALMASYSLLSGSGPPVIGNFGRYLFVLFPALVVLGLFALQPPVEALGARMGQWTRRPAAGVALVLLLAPSLAAVGVGAERYALNVRNVNDSDVAAAGWLRDRVPSDELIAVQDIGAIGFLTEHPLLDLAGIVTPDILPALERGRGPSQARPLAPLFEYLRARRPAYLVLFPESYGGLDALRAMEPGLVVRAGFEVPMNITMAGSQLVVLETPWTRPPSP